MVNKGKRSSISRLLRQMVKKHQDDSSLTYGALVKDLGDQAYGLILVLFALPSALPISVIPGFSFIFGLPIVFIAIHIIIGHPSLWLPNSLAKQVVDIKKLARVIDKTIPYLMYVERFLKPRWPFFSSPVMERLHGVVLLGLSLLLLLPIPFSNFIFASLIILFGLGLSERDGAVLGFAYFGSLLYGFFLVSLARGLLSFLFV